MQPQRKDDLSSYGKPSESTLKRSSILRTQTRPKTLFGFSNPSSIFNLPAKEESETKKPFPTEVTKEAEQICQLSRLKVKPPQFRPHSETALEETLLTFFREKGKAPEPVVEVEEVFGSYDVTPAPAIIVEENLDVDEKEEETHHEQHFLLPRIDTASV